MPKLTTLLQQTEDYPTYHPTVKTIFMGMAQAFDQDPKLLTKDTEELTQEFADTSHEQWRSFLSLPIVDQYIKSILRFNAQIGFRKAQNALTIQAASGNTQAAKQVTEISEILEQEQSNRTVVLTYVPRPTKTTPPDGTYPVGLNETYPLGYSQDSDPNPTIEGDDETP